MKYNTNISVQNTETGKEEFITLKSGLPCKVMPFIIGIGLTVAGVTILMVSSFRNGADNFDKAEWEAMDKAGIVYNTGVDIEKK